MRNLISFNRRGSRLLMTFLLLVLGLLLGFLRCNRVHQRIYTRRGYVCCLDRLWSCRCFVGAIKWFGIHPCVAQTLHRSEAQCWLVLDTIRFAHWLVFRIRFCIGTVIHLQVCSRSHYSINKTQLDSQCNSGFQE